MTLIQTKVVPSVLLRELTTDADIHAAQVLRYTVWQAEGAVIEQPDRGVITDEHDLHAIHWGAFDDGKLIGAARLCLHELLIDAPDGALFPSVNLPIPIASMNRMIVLSTYRGMGIGNKFDELRIARARDLGAGTIIGTPVSGLLREQSLEKKGFVFLVDVTGHPIWSPTICISACFLVLNASKVNHD